MVKISIIIPCYNHGQYIREALESIELYSDKSVYEIIIVNDGSTDPFTCDVMKQLEQEGYHVINQNNQGLGATRNNGIRQAKGQYILPLDSDNKILPNYINYSIDILDKHPEVGVVYGNSLFFGDENKVNKVPSFEFNELLQQNKIDACAVFRKSMWEAIGGYDEKMPVMGYEDWEFWIRAAKNGWKFEYIDEVLFEYRVLSNSMVKNTNMLENQRKTRHYIIKKHSEVYLTLNMYLKLFDEYLDIIHISSSLHRRAIKYENSYNNIKKSTWSLLKLFLKNILHI